MKELPYFKFHVSDWISGKITLEKHDVQGLFINICALYWQREGRLSLTETKRRLSDGKPKAFDSLIDNGLIKIENDFLQITFLDDQLGERKEKHEINKANGLLGGRPNKPKAFDSLTETKGIREDKIKEDKSEIREYGSQTQKHFVIVKGKYIQDRTSKVWGKDGLVAIHEANSTILNLSEYAEKYMRDRNGKVLNDFTHLQSDYQFFVKQLFK